MSGRIPAIIGSSAGADAVFPVLTADQIARISAHGRRRTIAKGEVLVKAGARTTQFFVLVEGELELVRPSDAGEDLVAIYRPGMFTGEVNMLTGRRGFVEIRATEDSIVIEVERERLLELIHSDSILSDIFMRAFILRRVELIAHKFGDVVLIGSSHSPGTLRVREFLTRNGHPFATVDLDRESGVQELLDRFHIKAEDIPVLICQGKNVLRNPTNRAIAECLGFNETIDQTKVRDVVIVGAGPSGLAAAVYAASEGLDVLVLEANAPGGQAGSSSKIENYLGFPTGISGGELASRALNQAEKFGAQIIIAKGARRLLCERKPYIIEIEDADSVSARTVIIATGAEYRRPTIENLPQFEGSGVYYGATPLEAQLCREEEVIVVGGGNSAGQAAVFLAQSAKRVHLLVRSRGLAETMSRYLVIRIEQSPNIELRTGTEIVKVEGNGKLETIHWRNNVGAIERRDIQHVFMMTGAIPSTQWLAGCVDMDTKGFIKTGPELSKEDLQTAKWPLTRPPYLLETSLPGVFAVGDVRAGNIKRVASAVGEGSIAIAFVHQVLHE